MNKLELYDKFDELHSRVILPTIETFLARGIFSNPIYHIIDHFELCRFRGAMPVLLAEYFGVDERPFTLIGAASELIFNIALVEDDIIDQDNARGKIAASHISFGYPLTIASIGIAYAAADKMVLGAIENLSAPTQKKILSGFNNAYRMLYESFATEVTKRAEFWGWITDDRLPESLECVHIAKTIQGTNALHCTGILLEERVAEFGEKLFNYSKELGVAAQIKNDIYDLTRYTGPENLSSDIKNGYITAPLIIHLSNLSESERIDFLHKIKDNSNHQTILKILQDEKIINKTIEISEGYVHRAKQQIMSLNLPLPVRELLVSWAEAQLLKKETIETSLRPSYTYRKEEKI